MASAPSSAHRPLTAPARSAPLPIGIVRRGGQARVARFADPPRRWYPEHLAVAAIWLGSVALGLWRIHQGG